MAITKSKKEEIVREGTGDLNEARALIFADFSGTNVSEIGNLRSELKNIGSKLRVIKKRLLRVIFEGEGINHDPLQFNEQVGTVFIKGDISETAGPLYRFSKTHEGFKLLGGYDLEKKEGIDGETINAIGSLPPKEVLLGHVLGSIVAPVRSLLYILSEKSKQG
ncbi:MAG: 50S ribosomal protein L10 [Patescibacteria group bacterium]